MENQSGLNSEHKLCRATSFDLAEGLHIKVMEEGNGVLAARNESFKGFHKVVSTDFPVKQEDGSNKWYEEFPTKTDPITGKSAVIETDLYKFDLLSGKRSEPISKDSAEYKAAHEALWVLRDRFTPKAIVMLPSCEIK